MIDLHIYHSKQNLSYKHIDINRIKQDWLRRCKCGGKWCLREFPLKWVGYTRRKEGEWEFFNRVFELMGLS